MVLNRSAIGPRESVAVVGLSSVVDEQRMIDQSDDLFISSSAVVDSDRQASKKAGGSSSLDDEELLPLLTGASSQLISVNMVMRPYVANMTRVKRKFSIPIVL